MSAPTGNQNAIGNKGGGRKSAYQEKADYELLERMFMEKASKKKVEARINSGNYSLKDMFFYKALVGNERILSQIFHKLFPNKKEIEHSCPTPIPILSYFTGEKLGTIDGGLSASEKDDEKEKS